MCNARYNRLGSDRSPPFQLHCILIDKNMRQYGFCGRRGCRLLLMYAVFSPGVGTGLHQFHPARLSLMELLSYFTFTEKRREIFRCGLFACLFPWVQLESTANGEKKRKIQVCMCGSACVGCQFLRATISSAPVAGGVLVFRVVRPVDTNGQKRRRSKRQAGKRVWSVWSECGRERA